MMSYLRRFVYLVVDGKRHRTLDLHRIDMSRFFTQRSLLIGEAVDARLPRPKMTFCAPSLEHCSGTMHFMLLGRDKVLATDQTGRASIYDAGLHALCTTPALSKPKHRPLHVIVGDRLYVLDSTRLKMMLSVRVSPPLRLLPTRASALQTASSTMTGVATLFQCHPAAPPTSAPMLWLATRTFGCLRMTRPPIHLTHQVGLGSRRETRPCPSGASHTTSLSTSSGLASPARTTFSAPSTSPGSSRLLSSSMSWKTLDHRRNGSQLHPF